MSKTSIARKGNRFVAAHNARVLRATKKLSRAANAAHAACIDAAFKFGLCSPEYDKANAAYKAAAQARDKARASRGYITPHDQVLIAIFGR